MANLREVIISITNRCNFRCRMCDIPSIVMEELTTQQWKTVIEDSYYLGAQTVVFSGGEPMLRKDIFELISFAKTKQLKVCITSNGSLIDDNIASKLAENKVDVVNISIDGPRQIHDYLRGHGSYEKAITALANLRKYRIEATIATMISKFNYKYLPQVVGVAKDYAVTTIKFQPFSKIFLNGDKNTDAFLISQDDINELEKILEETLSLINQYSISSNPQIYFKKIPLYLSNKNILTRNGCSALFSSCPINSCGQIYSCWVLASDNYLLGDLRKSRLYDIWNSGRRDKAIESVIKNGCPQCMMSCYDDVFGKDALDYKIMKNLAVIKNKGFAAFAGKWHKRFKFYLSYRGPVKKIFNRLRNNIGKKYAGDSFCDDSREDVLENIRQAKEILREEIKNYGRS